MAPGTPSSCEVTSATCKTGRMPFFPFDRDSRYAPILLALRVKDTDGVEVTDDGLLRATFGFAKIETPISNIDHTEITGPHQWFKAVGLRLSLTDDDVTFGTNPRRGLSISFIEKVPRVIGLRDHSKLWVSVTDPQALAAAIGR